MILHTTGAHARVLRIGDFSKLSQVSIKTLRYYDKMGLLKLLNVDGLIGYRYYLVNKKSLQ